MRYSFVLPVYGTEKYLPRCLDSIFAQTERDFEVIVVDDCSPGNCAEAVARYGDRVRYVRHDRNRSAFQARMTAVRAARGEYVVPVDPDDYVMPELLARLDGTIGASRPDMISYWIDWDDGRKVFPHWCRHPAGEMTGAAAIRELAEAKFMNGVATKAFRRETWLRAVAALAAPDDLYVNTADDYLVLLPVLMISERVAFLDYAGYRYFVNSESTSGTWKTQEGYNRACSEVRQVKDLVLEMANRRLADDPVLADVRSAVAGLERFFAAQAPDRKLVPALRRLVSRCLIRMGFDKIRST